MENAVPLNHPVLSMHTLELIPHNLLYVGRPYDYDSHREKTNDFSRLMTAGICFWSFCCCRLT
jgi:hypothetical protein